MQYPKVLRRETNQNIKKGCVFRQDTFVVAARLLDLLAAQRRSKMPYTLTS